MSNGRPDRVSVMLGRTLNLGNFESARLDTGVETDVRPGETLEEAQGHAYAAAEQFLGNLLEQVEQAQHGKGGKK